MGVCASSQLSLHIPSSSMLRHTLLSNLEELVRVPSHHTALESAPAPFDHARNDLFPSSALVFRVNGPRSYHWLRHAQLLGQGLAAEQLATIFAIKKVSHEGTDGARIRGRAEGKEEEREVESCRVPLACCCGTVRAESRLYVEGGHSRAGI